MNENYSPLELSVDQQYTEFHNAMRLLQKEVNRVRSENLPDLSLHADLVRAIQEAAKEYSEVIQPRQETKMHLTNQLLAKTLFKRTIPSYKIRTKGFCPYHQELNAKIEGMNDPDLRLLANPAASFLQSYRTTCAQCTKPDAVRYDDRTILEPRETTFIPLLYAQKHLRLIKSGLKGSSLIFKVADEMFHDPSVSEMEQIHQSTLQQWEQYADEWVDEEMYRLLSISVLDVQRHTVIIKGEDLNEEMALARSLADKLDGSWQKGIGRLFGLSVVDQTVQRGEYALRLFKTHMYLDPEETWLGKNVIEIQIMPERIEKDIRKIPPLDHDKYNKNKIPGRKRKGTPYKTACELIGTVFGIPSEKLDMHARGRSIDWD